MKAGTELFDLIKSLDGAEKGYFKKHCLINSRSNSDSNYLLLFDAIEAQEEFNEKALRSQFRDHAFARQFPVAKKYLYDRLLKALHSYHHSIFEEIRNYMHYAEILYNKKLYDQSLKALTKAKKISLRYDIHFYYQEILRWEANLAVAQYDLNWMEQIISESDKEMVFMQNNRRYNILSMTIMGLINRYGSVRKKFLLKKIEKAMKNPALKNESSALGFTSKLNFFAIHAFYWYAKENYLKAEKYFKLQLTLFLDNPEKAKVQFNAYMVSVNNLVGMLFQRHNYREIPQYLEIFRKEMAHQKKPIQQALLFYLHNHNLLAYMEGTGQFDKASELLPAMLREYHKHGKELNAFQKTILLVKISITWFGLKNYSKCLQYLNTIRNELSFKIQPDLNCFLQIYYILVHYEAGHYELLPSLITSADNFLKKQNIINRVENMLLSFFKKNSSKPDSAEIPAEMFLQLKRKILPLINDPNEKRSFEYFDYISWLDSKVEKKEFSEVVREKADKK